VSSIVKVERVGPGIQWRSTVPEVENVLGHDE
jgi:hypothetical protein